MALFSLPDKDQEKIQALLEITKLPGNGFTEKEVLEKLLKIISRILQGEAASLILYKAKEKKLLFEIALGPKSHKLEGQAFGSGKGIAAWVIDKKRAIIVNDVSRDNRFNAELDKLSGFKTRNIMACPLLMAEECLGCIEVLNKKGDQPFLEAELEWLEMAAFPAVSALRYYLLKEPGENQAEKLTSPVEYHHFCGKSELILKKREEAVRIAQSSSPVLICGESGVGKEIFAEQIHLNSSRKSGPFLRVNCAALSEDLLESEIFGHVRGAFTGAEKDRAGRLELAQDGTLFLDEIGDISINVQLKLLRMLENGRYEKLGSSELLYSNARIVAATNRDLISAIQEGKYRKDFYYRLSVLKLDLPPIRERPKDIMALAKFFIEVQEEKLSRKFSNTTENDLAILLDYHWPGNIRELRNFVERAAVLGSPDKLDWELVFHDLDQTSLAAEKSTAELHLKEAVHQFKKSFIEKTLEQCSGNRSQAAKQLGIQRTYLCRLIKELQING